MLTSDRVTVQLAIVIDYQHTVSVTCKSDRTNTKGNQRERDGGKWKFGDVPVAWHGLACGHGDGENQLGNGNSLAGRIPGRRKDFFGCATSLGIWGGAESSFGSESG